MIDLEWAKELVEDCLHHQAKLVGIAIRIREIEEHEWGWQFNLQNVVPPGTPPDQRPFAPTPLLVDRTNGNVVSASTAGPWFAIAKLLRARAESPPPVLPPRKGAVGPDAGADSGHAG